MSIQPRLALLVLLPVTFACSGAEEPNSTTAPAQPAAGAAGAAGATGTAGAPAAAPAAPAPASCDIATLFAADGNVGDGCAGAGCHGPGGFPPDLVSPGLSARLLNQPALICPQELYVDGANPDNSFLLKKILGTHGTCGAQMPLVNPGLEPLNEQCVRELAAYIAGGGML